jgi:dTDP-4-amino-4,6-dideoxygalactose transaminase
MPSADELIPFLRRIDQARWYTNFGPLVRGLEDALRARHQRNLAKPLHVVSVANATLGLQLVLSALALRPEGRVLVPALTFPATITSILHAGLVPVVCDIDKANWMLTPDIARHAASKTRIDAAMPVATFGCPQDCAAWDSFTADVGIPVVLDAAGAFGNQTAGSRVHVVLSLHATKTLGAGEGGALLTCDAGLAEHVRRLENFGFEAESPLVIAAGTNAKLSEYHAAVALASLGRWDARSQVRIALHRDYLDGFRARCRGVTPQQRPRDGVYSILSVLLPADRGAEQAGAYLSARDIESRRWYCPTVLHHPAFSNVETAGPLDVAQTLNDRLLGLPFHPFLEAGAREHVTAALASYLAD